MRWFVEVSRVGGASQADKICVDAKAWQGALQEARKRQGDDGPLSSFSIELLDDGYRAVDPRTKLKYLVHKAPADAPLTPDDSKPKVGKGASPRTARPATEPPRPVAGPSRPAAGASKMAGTSSATPAPAGAPPEPAAEEPSAKPPAVEGAPPKAVPAKGPRVPDDHVPVPLIRKSSAPALSVRGGGKMPDFKLIKEREQDPSARSPLTYREYAYAVEPGTSEADAEILLWTRFNDVAFKLDDRPSGKFVQLAVFDHAFRDRPARPPIATLAWKDWRGEPVLQFPLAKRAAKDAESAAPAPAPVPTAPQAAPQQLGAAQPPAPPDAARSPSAGPPPAPAGGPARKDSDAAMAAVRKSTPPRRRSAGDDLIGDLFEAMHELRFMPDIVSGCDFVLEVMKQTLPSEGVLIHVFDINSRNFVVVRAVGPGNADVLMHRTSDTDTFLRASLRQSRARKWDAGLPDHFANGAWRTLGVNATAAMFGPVVQGGRYLGAIEIVNPLGGGGYYDSEANALEYICEQLAEFLANRPIVVDAESVLPGA